MDSKYTLDYKFVLEGYPFLTFPIRSTYTLSVPCESSFINQNCPTLTSVVPPCLFRSVSSPVGSGDIFYLSQVNPLFFLSPYPHLPVKIVPLSYLHRIDPKCFERPLIVLPSVFSIQSRSMTDQNIRSGSLQSN